MLNISQSVRKPRKKGQEPEMQGTGDGRFGPPTPPPSPVYKPKAAWDKLQVSLYNPKTLLAGSAAKRKQPRDAVQNPYLGHYYRQNLTKLQSRTDEIENFSAPSPLPPSPPNKFQGWEKGVFWLLRGFILGVEWALLFHSFLSKIVVIITLRWVYEEKNTCRSSNEHWLEAKTGW